MTLAGGRPVNLVKQLSRLQAQDARRQQVVAVALTARDRGDTLRQAAAVAGIHVSTLCRWGQRDAWLRRALRVYGGEARFLRRLRNRVRPPPLPWHRSCPACGAAAQ